MKVLSMLFYFFGHHGAWSFVVLLLLGILLSAWRKKWGYLLLGFILAMANVFTGQFVNAWFLARFGERGTGVITAAEETNSTLNDSYIWDYEAVIRTAEGKDVVTGFSTMTAALYPIRNSILIPPEGERFVVKYVPGFEKNIVIMVDESPYGKRMQSRENRKPVESAQKRYRASPGNKEFKEEYRKAMREFIADPANVADTMSLKEFRSGIATLEEQQ